MVPRLRIPTPVLVLLALDLALILAYLLNDWAGQPFSRLTELLDLDGEANLPTWYSSLQWFGVAAMLGVFAYRNFTFLSVRSWLLVAFALVFLMFSLDEIARLHEWLGRRSDALLPGGDRTNTWFARTGIWVFVLGVPFLALLAALAVAIRPYFRLARGALSKLVLGMAVTMLGALGVEILDNLVTSGSRLARLQVLAEESLELLGGTFVLWGSLELLHRSGIVLVVPKKLASAVRLGRVDAGLSPSDYDAGRA